MSQTPTKVITAVANNLCRLLGLALLLTLLSARATAQTAPASGSSDAITPIGMKPGAPAGSYALSGFDNIDYFSGLMNFHLPLLSIGGRGSAGYTMMLSIQQTWQVRHARAPSGCGPGGCTGPTIHTYIPDPNPWEVVTPGFTPGVMVTREAGHNFTNVGGCNWYAQTLTRMTFIGPDGTEYDFRDQLYNGQPRPNSCNGSISRGRVFTTYDGSNVTFISDTVITEPSWFTTTQFYPTGYMLLKDGTRYRINNGGVQWIQDREGNRVTFGTQSGQYTITDSLGRQVTIEASVTDPTYGLCTRIHFNGAGGTPRTIWIRYDSLGNALHTGYSLQTFAQLFPGLNGASSTGQFNYTVVKGIVLPDGRQYEFKYNSYRDLVWVKLPTGGAYEYVYASGSGVYTSGLGSDNTDEYGVNRRVVERRVYKDASTMTMEGKTTITAGTPTVVDSLTPSGTLLAREKHYFYGNPLASQGTPTSYPTWQQGKEYQTDLYDVVSGTATLKKSITSTFMQKAALSWWTGAANDSPANDPREVETVMTLVDTNQVSKTTSINPSNGSVGFDQYNNPTDTWEYGFGTGAPSTYPVRHSHTDYLTYNSANGIYYDTVNPSTSAPDPAATIHLRGLPVAQLVYMVNPSNGAETLVAQSTTAYDESSYSVLTYSSVTGWYAPGTAGRGNPTTASRWLSTTGTWLSTHAQYDQVGNVRSTWDAKGNQAQVTYDDSYSDNIPRNTYAYATSATTPIPDPTGGHGSSTAFGTTAKYDYSTGLMTSQTDANGQTSTLAYGDALDRPTQLIRAVGTTKQSQTTVAYDDANHVITTTSDKDTLNDNALKNQTVYDGLGRTTETRTYESASGYIAIDQAYDALGRISQTSNPYRSGGTISWTTTSYDGLGRVLAITSPGGAQVTTSYSGNQVTATDSAGRQRRSVTDALGRLTQVIEAPNDSNFNYQTTYSYDALGNLITVTQGTQHRYFMYDSLSRLIRAKNPEQDANPSLALSDPTSGNSQWSLAYSYDNNSNISSKTDARGVSFTRTYDNLNRNTVVNYSDGSHTDRVYDSATNGRGKLYYSAFYPNTGDYSLTVVDTYDAMGQPRYQRQHFWASGSWGTAFVTQRDYDLAGHAISQIYPSGKTVTYNYDQAGRLGDKDAQNPAFKGDLGGVTRTYSSGIIYSPLGGMAKEQFGTDTPIYNKSFYNSRGQLSEIRVGTYNASDETWWNRGAIINHYSNNCWGMCGQPGDTMPDNNGNLKKQEVYIPNNESISSYTTWWQGYDYDSLNRLQRVHEYTGDSARDWQQEYVYDRWGNRTVHQSNTWGPTLGSPIPKPNFGVNTSTNRLTPPVGAMTYDNAGNLTNDTYTGAGSRSYDAENRMTQAWGGTNQQQFYTYNAEGQRVRRKVNGVETWQVYGMDGELLAEYAANGATVSPLKEYGYRSGQLLVTAESSTTPVDTVWVEDSLPAGAIPAGDGEGWNWVSSNPSPASGSAAHQSNIVGGVHQHFFYGASSTLSVAAGEKLFAYVYLDPANLPSEVMLQWNNGNWEHRAYWGANNLGWGVDGTDSRRYMGALPAAGGWVRLEVPASLIGLEGHTLNGMAFSLHNGRATWDRVGKTSSGAATTNITWLVTDQLGTPRIVIDKTGSLANVKRHDYLPFGEELVATQGLRTTSLGYTADTLRQKFTSYERDNETGLDFAQARYFSSPQGRFISVDPLAASSNVSNPQSFNRYTYVLNNPMNATDPTGMSGIGLDPFELLDDGPYLRMLEDEEQRLIEAQQQRQRQRQPQRHPQKEKQKQPQRIDVTKDKTISTQVDKIKKAAKPLAPGQTPALTSVVPIVGDTYNVDNAILVDAYGQETKTGLDGTIRPIAYVPLDQGGNIIPDASGIGVQEVISENGGPKKTLPENRPAPAPPGGIFYDIQLTTRGQDPMNVRQQVFMGQFSRSGAVTSLFSTGPNSIALSPPVGKNPGSITVTIGSTTRLR